MKKLDNKIPLFVLNNFLKFERKIYQVFGLKLGRPLSLKLVLYFIVIAIIEAAIYFTPFVGKLINWLPFSVLVMIPILFAWLLSDVGTEGRSPVFFFRSFFSYHIRNLIEKKDYVRGRKILRANDYQLDKYMTYQMSNTDVEAMQFQNAFSASAVNKAQHEVQENLVNEVPPVETPDSKEDEIQTINQQFFSSNIESESVSDSVTENEIALEEKELDLTEQFEQHISIEVNEQERINVEQFQKEKKDLKESSGQFFRNLKGKVQKVKVEEKEVNETPFNQQVEPELVEDVNLEVDTVQHTEKLEPNFEQGLKEPQVETTISQPHTNTSLNKENYVEQEKSQTVKKEKVISKQYEMPKLTVIQSEKKAPIRPQPKPIHQQSKLTTWQMMKMYMRSNARNKAKKKIK